LLYECSGLHQTISPAMERAVAAFVPTCHAALLSKPFVDLEVLADAAYRLQPGLKLQIPPDG